MTVIIDGTNGITPAQWTTAGRPSSPTVGQQGWNTTLVAYEIWNGSSWQIVAGGPYTVSYLLTAGGGTGGTGDGGGGGAGGTCRVTGTAGTIYTGGGGGGGGGNGASGGTGGSGVVILTYQSGTQRGAGGSVTYYGSAPTINWVHIFTASGTYIA